MSTENNSKDLIQEIQEISKEFENSYAILMDKPVETEVQTTKVKFLGKKGLVQNLMEQLKLADKKDRPNFGKEINILRNKIETSLIKVQKLALESKVLSKLDIEPIDVSLPVTERKAKGSLHPVTIMKNLLIDQFHHMGFTIFDGPEIDLDYYNFSALNFKDDHPARDMQDTFFIENSTDILLRTHTSNVQIHTMKNNPPPLRGVSLGRTFRCDSDLTHTPMFHQIEGFVVDQNISMGDMKGIIDQFLKAIFGQNLETRLRPSYFPFVEPGGEVDLQCVECKGKGCRICSQTGWLELGGLGMIHPNVFEACDLDSERYSGFAFGFGIDRMAMLKFGITDLRVMFEGNYNFLNQFQSNEIIHNG